MVGPIIQLGAVSVIFAAPAHVLGYWMAPCLPSNFGFFLIPQCNPYRLSNETNVYFNLLTKLFVTTISAILPFTLLTAFILEFQFSFMICYCIKNYLLYYKSVLKLLNGSYEHNLAHSRYTTDLQRNVLMFRNIQILLIHFNEYHAKYLVVVKIIGQALFITLGIYSFIRLSNVLPVAQFLVYGVGILDSLIGVIFCYGMKAQVFSVSGALKTQNKNSVSRNLLRSKWFQRYFRSCPQLKVKIGSVNFVDEFTPLSIISLSLGQLVNFLLF